MKKKVMLSLLIILISFIICVTGEDNGGYSLDGIVNVTNSLPPLIEHIVVKVLDWMPVIIVLLFIIFCFHILDRWM